MYQNLEIVNKENHKNQSVREIKDFSYAKNIMNAPITIAEFFEACKNYPIFFAKDKDNKWFASVLLGYKQGENLFIDEKGVWKELHYIPAFVRTYPFILVNQENQKDLVIAIEKDFLTDEENPKKLFDTEGNNSEFLNSALNFLNQYYADSISTTQFIKQLEDWELLEEKIATVVNNKSEKFNLNGFFVINEEKLKHLSKKKKDDICAKNAYSLITAHLISLSNIQKLGAIK